MVSIIGSKEDIRVVQRTSLVQLFNQIANHVIDRLKRTQTLPLELIVVLDERVI